MSASDAAPRTRFSAGLSSVVTTFFLATTTFLSATSEGCSLCFSFLRVATSASTSSNENAIGAFFLSAASPSRATDACLTDTLLSVLFTLDFLGAAFFAAFFVAGAFVFLVVIE